MPEKPEDIIEVFKQLCADNDLREELNADVDAGPKPVGTPPAKLMTNDPFK